MHIPLPEQFSDPAALAFACELARHVHEPDVVLDFASVQFVYPYGTLVIAHAIKNFTTRRWVSNLKTSVVGHQQKCAAISYLRYFGFFRYINVAGATDEEAPGGGRYLPVTVLNRSTLNSTRPGAVFQDAIEECSYRLARVIFPRQVEQSAINMLSYCFRELIRNSFEHANVSTCAIMAQRWDNGVAEVAIADRGIGIFRALAAAHSLTTPDDAVRFALRPGISSAAGSGTGSKWDNTGFGLYVVSQLGKKFGSFAMLSAERYINPASETDVLKRIPLPGTLVKLRVATRDQEYWPEVLDGIVAAGESEAKLIPGAVTSASIGSKKSNTWQS